MSAEPAMNDVAEVAHLHDYRPLSPQAQQVLAEQVTDLNDKVNALTSALSAAKRRESKLKKEIRDLLEQSSDSDTVLKCLDYWAMKTGRRDAKVTMAGSRATHVRWILRHYEPRDFCLAVLGLINDPFYTEKGLDDVHHMVVVRDRINGTVITRYDEARFERFLTLGRHLLGVNK